MWNTSDRFPESPTRSQTFNTFSEYLRHQFHLSKNSGKHIDILTDGTANKNTSSISPHSVSWTGNKNERDISPDSFFLTEQPHDFYDFPASQNRIKPKLPTTTISRKKVSPFEEARPPGPGSYHVTPSMVKPTFNRTYITPHHPEYRKHQLSKKYGRSQPIVPEMTSNTAGAFFNMKKYRSLSAPAGGRTYSVPKKLTSGDHLNAKNPALMNNRYPPNSDQIIKRWSSVANESFKIPKKHF